MLPVVMLGMLGIAIWAANLASFPEANHVGCPLSVGSLEDVVSPFFLVCFGRSWKSTQGIFY